jgi:hypothetical protein
MHTYVYAFTCTSDQQKSDFCLTKLRKTVMQALSVLYAPASWPPLHEQKCVQLSHELRLQSYTLECLNVSKFSKFKWLNLPTLFLLSVSALHNRAGSINVLHNKDSVTEW